MNQSPYQEFYPLTFNNYAHHLIIIKLQFRYYAMHRYATLPFELKKSSKIYDTI